MVDARKWLRLILSIVALYLPVQTFLVSNLPPNLDFLKNYFSFSIVVSMLITGVYLMWSNYLWKYNNMATRVISNFTGLPHVPNISGSYKGKYFSSYKFNWDKPSDGYVTTGEVVITITQPNCNKIVVESRFPRLDGKSSSDSISKSAFFEVMSDHKFNLLYSYTNKTDFDNHELLASPLGAGQHDGIGTFEDIIFENDRCLKGIYCSSENRKTRGYIEVEKSPSKLIQHL